MFGLLMIGFPSSEGQMYLESYQILVLIKACVETAERWSLFRMIPHPVRALRFYLRRVLCYFFVIEFIKSLTEIFSLFRMVINSILLERFLN
jgi:hypothetical protein